MALPVKQQLLSWSLVALVFLLSLWFLGDVILPFIVGGAIAYCLDPVADRLERLGMGRVGATALIAVVVLGVLIISVLLILPLMVEQFQSLVAIVPDIVSQLQVFLSERFPSLQDPESTLRQSLSSFAQMIQSRGGELANQILASAISVINALVFVIVVPVVAVYMLLDWDKMIARIDSWLPRDHVESVRMIARDVDATLASFVRGQLTVCTILGTFYAVALMLVGLQFGLIVGAVAGLLTFIPYVGSLVGGALSIGLALFQFWNEPLWIVAVAAIFVVGQTVEGNYLTPKLVGGSVGLHPVWLLFALSAFGAVFGFVGLLVAVPVAAVIGVVARFIVGKYTDSRLYRGLTDWRDEDGD